MIVFLRFLIKTLAAVGLLFTLGCGEKRKQQDASSYAEFLPALRQAFANMQGQAERLRDSNGWLAGRDCDGILWAAKYASASPELCGQVNIEAAEFAEQPGRFGRRVAPRCWTPEGGDQGSKTTWSRDMAVAGLLPWAYLCNRLDVLERHVAYGRANNWQMGEPFADGRALYSTNVLSLLFKAIEALGGEGSNHTAWPTVYPGGLTDYQAHLQVASIWLRGEIEVAAGNSDAIAKTALLDVSENMYQRLKEHAERSPNTVYYQVAYGRYSGQLLPAIDHCLNPDAAAAEGEYVRCEDPAQCLLADKLHACGLLIRHIKGFTDGGDY